MGRSWYADETRAAFPVLVATAAAVRAVDAAGAIRASVGMAIKKALTTLAVLLR